MRLVIDASVAIKWFLSEELQREALALLEQDHHFIAPDLLMAEVGNILWKRIRRGEMEPMEAAQVLKGLRELDLEVHAIADLVEAALEIGNQSDTTVYDGIYMALAVQTDSILLTADRNFHRKVADGELASSIRLLGVPFEKEGKADAEDG